MTSNVKLLPLPEPKMDAAEGGLDWTDDEMADYALANVLHHTAPLRYALDNAARSIKSLRGVMDSHAAEIVALRAEVRTLVRQNGEWQARVERLAEALDIIARVGKASRNQTTRTRWIVARAISALNGDDDWQALSKPKGFHDALLHPPTAAQEVGNWTCEMRPNA